MRGENTNKLSLELGLALVPPGRLAEAAYDRVISAEPGCVAVFCNATLTGRALMKLLSLSFMSACLIRVLIRIIS